MENPNEEPKPVTESTEEKKAEKTEKPKRLQFSVSKKTIWWIVGLVVLAGLGAAFYFAKGLFVAATVNGQPISRLEVVRELEKNAGEQTLNSLVTEELITQEARKRGIKVKPSEIDEEIKKVEAQVAGQGATLEMLLSQQGRTLDDFREQVLIQKALEKILEEKIQVSDEEINQFVAQGQSTRPEGMSEEDFRDQARDQLRNQKFSREAGNWIGEARSAANIQYFVGYVKPEPAPAEASGGEIQE